MIDATRVAPGSPPRLTERDPRADLGLGSKDTAKQIRGDLGKRLSTLQGRLFAESERSVLLVLQGLDASGKDGVIRRVFEGVNPMGVHVTSFRAPTEKERAHDYLWRIHAELPPRGHMGVFNRSHYEDVVAVRMQVLHETSTEWASWHVVPADRNWVKSTAVATLLVDTLERLDPKLPEPEPGVEGLVIE